MVTRFAPVVRPADKQDLPALLDIYEELREPGRRSAAQSRAQNRAQNRSQDRSQNTTLTRGAVEDRLLAALDDPGAQLLLAVVDGRAAGAALVGRAAPLPAAHDLAAQDLAGGGGADGSAQLAFLVVAPRMRRRGVGQALLLAAANYAEERGLGAVAVSVPSMHREGNRFYARLGFAPVAVHRSVPTAALRRRLGGARSAADPDVRRRLRLRARAQAARRELG